MIRTIPLKIQNEYITGDKGMIGAAGSHNDVILRMEFSGMWDGLTKMVQFRDALGEATIEVLLTADMLEADDTSVYLVPVPNGAKKYAGEMTLCIKGAAVSAQKETRATLAVYGRFTVAESKWSADAETEADVPASNVEKLQGQIDNVLATIVDARKAATEAAKSAEGAALSQSRAQTSEQYAGEYAQDAADSATAAARSAARAESYNSGAKKSADRAATSATNAASSERNAGSYAATANGAKYDAESAATEAASSQSAAKQSENNAKTYESDARSSANNAGASERNASTYASSAAESIKHAPRINADGKWELWDASKNAYVATEYTAIGKNGVRGRGWYQYGVKASNPQAAAWTGLPAAPKWGKGDWLYNPDNGNVGLCTSRTDNADGSGHANITYTGTLKGTDGITPTIGTNGNWYLGETDTGMPSRGEQGPGAEVFYIDLEGSYPDYTCPVAMADIKAAYEAGKVLECRCMKGKFMAVLPLYIPTPELGLWVFSGSGQLTAMQVPAQAFTIAITPNGVLVDVAFLATTEDKLPNPYALTITSGNTTVTYDGSEAKTIDIPAGVGDDTPDYVLTAADALAKKVVNHIGADNIVFAVMADAHLGYYTDTGNAAGKQAGQALKRLNERCALDFVAHVGDYTTGAYNTTVESAMRDMADYQLLIGSKFPGRQAWCVGNHDDAPYQATANRMSQTQVYAAISRKNLASNGYVPDNAAYGYMDFPALRLRLIYLDTHDRRSWGSAQVGAGENCAFLNVENISAAQLQWLADHALNFSGVDDPSKWSILVLSHAVLGTSGTYTDPSGTVHPCNTANAATLLKAYATKKSGSITHGGVTVNYNFTTITPAGIIGCIHGHEHRYANEIVGGAFLSICCPNIMNGRERVSADGNTYTKTAGTANGTSFCVFSINRADKKIYVDHYGPGVDRVFDYTVIDPSAPSYTNLLPSATDTDGSIYNGVGWEKGYRLGSDGAPTGQNDSYLTGFIPVKFGDVVHLKNVKWQNGVTTGLNSGNQRVAFYDANKVHLGQTNAIGLGGTLSGVKDDNNIWTQFTVKNWTGVDLANTAYFRLNCAEISGDSIITVNEEIT
jgi:hypothetical protein